jgi:hypothetical protein
MHLTWRMRCMYGYVSGRRRPCTASVHRPCRDSLREKRSDHRGSANLRPNDWTVVAGVIPAFVGRGIARGLGAERDRHEPRSACPRTLGVAIPRSAKTAPRSGSGAPSAATTTLWLMPRGGRSATAGPPRLAALLGRSVARGCARATSVRVWSLQPRSRSRAAPIPAPAPLGRSVARASVATMFVSNLPAHRLDKVVLAASPVAPLLGYATRARSVSAAYVLVSPVPPLLVSAVGTAQASTA